MWGHRPRQTRSDATARRVTEPTATTSEANHGHLLEPDVLLPAACGADHGPCTGISRIKVMCSLIAAAGVPAVPEGPPALHVSACAVTCVHTVRPRVDACRDAPEAGRALRRLRVQHCPTRCCKVIARDSQLPNPGWGCTQHASEMQTALGSSVCVSQVSAAAVMLDSASKVRQQLQSPPSA